VSREKHISIEIPHACSRIGNNSDASPKQPAEVPALRDGALATSATKILSWGISVIQLDRWNALCYTLYQKKLFLEGNEGDV